jgi:hypothetical protein
VHTWSNEENVLDDAFINFPLLAAEWVALAALTAMFISFAGIKKSPEPPPTT